MAFCSYSQNFEDVILWRCLKNVSNGFYIDVGAQDPIADSVSLAFYQRGWRGVHVEPTAEYAQKLRTARPDETVLEVAVGQSASKIPFWTFPGTGLSTGDPAIAERHRSESRAANLIEVATVPLSSILESQKNRPVHWLKIDVEGMEEDVIGSWGGSTVRPWIVLVESTKPLSQEETFAAWEPRLIALGYSFVYFDGVNRFYVSNEQARLTKSFGPGPNFFDDFEVSEGSIYAKGLHDELTVAHRSIEALSNSLETEAERSISFHSTLSRTVDTWERNSVVNANLSEVLTTEIAAKRSLISELERKLDEQSIVMRDKENKFKADIEKINEQSVQVAESITSKLEGLRLTSESSLKSKDNEIDLLRRRVFEAEAANAEVLAERDAAVLHLEQKLASLSLEVKARFDQQASATNALSLALKSQELHSAQLNESLLAMRLSTSWRITSPIRSISDSLRRAGRPMLERILSLSRRYPAVKPTIWALISFMPFLRNKVIHFCSVRRGGSRPAVTLSSLAPQTSKGTPADCGLNPRLPPLSLRARRIYVDMNP